MYTERAGGIGVVEMLFSTSLMIVVGGGERVRFGVCVQATGLTAHSLVRRHALHPHTITAVLVVDLCSSAVVLPAHHASVEHKDSVVADGAGL
jgi:hypothetical protein